MLTKGRGKIAALILARLKEKDEPRDESDDEGERSSESSSDDERDPGLVSAMEDFIAAVKRGDAEAASEALASWDHQHEDCAGCEED